VREGRVLFGGAYLDAAEPADEVGVPVLAPELTVGDDLEADPLLTRDHVVDRGILNRAQTSGVDFAARKRCACGDDLGWAQKTADMVGAKKRLHFR
jgi:hypothetical protein